jgi:glucose-1-phosphate thymidylyltransferase
MKCVIPAAGFGTRMKSIAEDTPKTLLKVKGKAMLDLIIERIIEIPEITEITIISNGKFYEKFNQWKQQSSYKIPIRLINNKILKNEDRQGGIRDIRLGIDMDTDENYLVINSDNLFKVSLKKVYDYFKQVSNDVLVVCDIKSIEEARKMGNVELNKDKIISNFIEKPENPKSTLAATGIYFFKNSTIKLWDKYLNEGNNPEGSGFFIQWLYKRKPVSCYTIDEWYDIGSIEMYEKVNER